VPGKLLCSGLGSLRQHDHNVLLLEFGIDCLEVQVTLLKFMSSALIRVISPAHRPAPASRNRRYRSVIFGGLLQRLNSMAARNFSSPCLQEEPLSYFEFVILGIIGN
jgi:hypothetical protein